MNNLEKMIKAAASGDNRTFEETLKSELLGRIGARIDANRAQLADAIYNAPNEKGAKN